MTIAIIIIVALGATGFICGVVHGVRENYAPEEVSVEAVENEELEDTSESDEYADVRTIVWEAYKSLKDQRAGGYGPWLSACLSNPTTPVMARSAIYRVLVELNGSRFNLDGLRRAVYALDEMVEGE